MDYLAIKRSFPLQFLSNFWMHADFISFMFKSVAIRLYFISDTYPDTGYVC